MLDVVAETKHIWRLIEAAMHVYEDCMQGEAYYAPSVLHNHGTQWECRELARVNATRPASRICFTLPLSAYEARRPSLLNLCCDLDG